MTNYEKMMQEMIQEMTREMTPEKMADTMQCPYDAEELPCVPGSRNCIECCEEWLNKEVCENGRI